MEVMLAALASLTFRPRRTTPVDGRAFGAMAGHAYRNAVFVILCMIAVEMPTVHLLLGVMIDEGVARSITQGALLVSSLCLALWLIGDLRLLRETPGFVVGLQRLEVALGQRARGTVALRDVVRVECEDDDSTADDDSRPIRLTPLPAPNCRIWLRQPATLQGPMGWPLQGDRLDVYVDDPEGFVAAMQSASHVRKR